MDSVFRNGNTKDHKCISNAYSQQDIRKDGDGNTGVEKSVPLAIKELVKEHFTPGVKGYFEWRTSLPLLKSTNLAILKRQTTNDEKTRKLRLDVPLLNGNSGKNRHSSPEAELHKGSDLYLVKACWEIILSFMGDQPETMDRVQSNTLSVSKTETQRQTLPSKKKLWRKLSNADVVMRKRSPSKRPASMIVTSDCNGNTDARKPLVEDKQPTLSPEALATMTVLDKVRFLSNVGLENLHFQDEIYCQIMKQLVDNPSVRSSALGWILLALIMGCFSPSEKILDYTEAFLHHQQTACSRYCLEKLTRTLLNGDRKNPPCSLELQAAKSRQQMRVPVICMDHSVRTVATDSATTAAEMCASMASKNRLGDSFGFSLYLALDEKLVSLGSERFRVLDAISQAESFSKQNNVREAWKIYYRREFFSPLEVIGGVNSNEMKTWLTYSQICGGVHSGEYHCTKSQDLALLLAHQYYVRHGLGQISMKRIIAVCEQSLPINVYNEGKTKKWCKMVYTTLKALEAKYRHGGKFDTLDIMGQVSRYGSVAFIENFTKTFFLSSFQANSEKSSVSDVTMKINHNKVVISGEGASVSKNEDTEDDNNILLEINVGRLKSLQLLRSSQDEVMEMKLTLQNDNAYLIRSSQLKEISKILEHYILEVTSSTSTESSA